MADGLIHFETADRPLTAGRSKFPYDAVLHSLKNLASTKSIIFKDKECTNNNITFLRKLAKQTGLGFVKVCRKDGRVHLWVNGE